MPIYLAILPGPSKKEILKKYHSCSEHRIFVSSHLGVSYVGPSGAKRRALEALGRWRWSLWREAPKCGNSGDLKRGQERGTGVDVSGAKHQALEILREKPGWLAGYGKRNSGFEYRGDTTVVEKDDDDYDTTKNIVEAYRRQ